ERTSAGSAALCMTAQRRIALLLTLFTFCPPGPALRANVSSSSASGIRIRELTTSIGRQKLKDMNQNATIVAPPRGQGNAARRGVRRTLCNLTRNSCRLMSAICALGLLSGHMPTGYGGEVGTPTGAASAA